MNSTATPERVHVSLHPGQQTVWRSPARYKVVVAGRRWGKTHLARAWLLSQAMRQGAGRYWYVAPTREDAKDIMWSDLKQIVHPEWLAEAPRESDLSVLLINGAEIRLWSAEKGDALRGRALKALVMDEYAQMKQALYDEVLSPSMVDHQAPGLFIGTPKSFNHFYRLFEKGQLSEWHGWDSWQFTSISNPTLSREWVDSQRAELDERTFQQEYEATFETVAGRAYYAFNRRENVAPVTWDRTFEACLTFDFNVEPASAIIGQVQGDRACAWREVQLTHRGGEATNATALKAQQLLEAVGHTGGLRLYGDATGRAAKTTGPADHAVLRTRFPGARWLIPHQNPHERDRVAAVNGMCQSADGRRRLVVDPSCTRLIADLEQVIYADNGELDKRSNPMLTHLSDALGYWLVRDFSPIPRAYVATIGPRAETVPSAIAAARARRRKGILDGLS